jgi:hypothetical protein
LPTSKEVPPPSIETAREREEVGRPGIYKMVIEINSNEKKIGEIVTKAVTDHSKSNAGYP